MITICTTRSSAEPVSGWTVVMPVGWPYRYHGVLASTIISSISPRARSGASAALVGAGRSSRAGCRLGAQRGLRRPRHGAHANRRHRRQTVTDVTSRLPSPPRDVRTSGRWSDHLCGRYGGQERRQEAGRSQATLASPSQRRPCGTRVTSSDGEPARMASEGATWSARTRRARVMCGLQRPSRTRRTRASAESARPAAAGRAARATPPPGGRARSRPGGDRRASGCRPPAPGRGRRTAPAAPRRQRSRWHRRPTA